MSSFKVSEYISCILINNENMSSGKYLTLVKTTLLMGQSGETVVASLPTSPSRDVMANIPILVGNDELSDELLGKFYYRL